MEKQASEPQGSLLDILRMRPDIESGKTIERLNPTPCLVRDFIWPGQIIQLKAESGGGTWVACDIARGIVEGAKLISQFECSDPTGVIYLQGGMPHAHLVDRITRLTIGNNQCPIKVISAELFNSEDKPDLCNEIFQDEIFSWLTDNNDYRVIILDGVDCFLPDKPEPKDIGRFLSICRRTSVTVISVESNGRGGIPIPWGQADMILKTKVLEGFEDLIIRCSFEKARSLKRDQQKTFFIKLEELDGSKLAFTECIIDEFLKAKTVQLLLNNWTQAKIAHETGKDQSTISRWITNSIIPNSLLAKDGRKYLLTEAGRKSLRMHGLDSEI